MQALNVPVGLGSYVQWDRKLDGRLAQAVMSIQAIKGVEVGEGFENAAVPAHRHTTPSCRETMDPPAPRTALEAWKAE